MSNSYLTLSCLHKVQAYVEACSELIEQMFFSSFKDLFWEGLLKLSFDKNVLAIFKFNTSIIKLDFKRISYG